MGTFISHEKITAIGKQIETQIGDDREYILIVGEKNGRGVQYVKSMPMHKTITRLVGFIDNVSNNGMMETPRGN